MSLRLRIYLGFSIICIIWGSSWAAVKLGLETVPPILALSLRFSLASIFLGIVILFKKIAIPKNSKFWLIVIVLCLTSFTIPFILIYWAQIQINSGLASVLFATYPFWVAVLSHFLLPNEKITFARMLGMILGFSGLIIIFNDVFSDINAKALLGMGAILVGSIIQAFSLIAIRKYAQEINSVIINFWPMLISAIVLFLISFSFEDYTDIIFDQRAIISLTYLALFCTSITFVIYFWLIKHVNVVILSFSAFITPIIAILIAIIFLDEIFSRFVYIGSILVIVGVGIATIGDIFGVQQIKETI